MFEGFDILVRYQSSYVSSSITTDALYLRKSARTQRPYDLFFFTWSQFSKNSPIWGLEPKAPAKDSAGTAASV